MDKAANITIYNKPGGSWPKAVILKLANTTEQSDTYYIQNTCTMDCVEVEDNVYHCTCSRCGKSGDPWDKYCRHCGAKAVKKGELK